MLTISGLSKSFGGRVLFNDVSLQINREDRIGLVGPNGAGKTTLIDAIAGLNRVAAGSITIDGEDLSRLPSHRFCDRGIAIVPEGRRLFTSLTVRENLELGSYRQAAKAERANSLAQVLEVFPALKVKLEDSAGTLSGGQQQMVAIGRALMCRPRLLLLDEPSLGLAPAIVLEMFEVIRKINSGGMAVLLVEQNVAMALEVAQRAYVLEEGRIATEGTPAELLASPHIRRAYLGEA